MKPIQLTGPVRQVFRNKAPRIPTLRQSAATKRNWQRLRLKCAIATLRGFLPPGDWRDRVDAAGQVALDEVEREWKRELERIASNESAP